MSPTLLEVYRRALRLPDDATPDQVRAAVRAAIAATARHPDPLLHSLRAECTERTATMAHPPPIDHRTSPTATTEPTPGRLTAREREYCALYGCDERTYVRLRDERDAKNAKADAARLARRRAEREAMGRAAAALRGRQ